MTGSVVLKELLRDRHWQVYRTFCVEYDKAARGIDRALVGTYPSRAQLHRWLAGDLKRLPHPHHCQVLEAMLPGIRAHEMFEPLTAQPVPTDQAQTVPSDESQTDLRVLVATGLGAPAVRLGGWRPEQLAPARTAPKSYFAGQGNSPSTSHRSDTANRIAQAVLLMGQKLRLNHAEVTELAKLSGHVVDLELSCLINIVADGAAEVTYRFHLMNLTDKPVKRMSREQWFENTDRRLEIEPHPDSDRDVWIQRIHDTTGMSKFACVFSPAVEPGEIATVAYTSRGGLFLNNHYWRQSTPRYTRHFTLTIRHHGAEMLSNCTAIVDGNDGTQASAIDDLVYTHEDNCALIVLTRDYLQPNDAITVRWEVARGTA